MLQVSVTVSVVQPATGELLHERVKLAEELVAAVLEHDGLAQPAALKELNISVQMSDVNVESEVPGASVKLIGSVTGDGAGTVEQMPSAQHVIGVPVAVHVPA